MPALRPLPRCAPAGRPGSGRSGPGAPHPPRRAASSRRTDARPRSASAATPCSRRAGFWYFGRGCSMRVISCRLAARHAPALARGLARACGACSDAARKRWAASAQLLDIASCRSWLRATRSSASRRSHQRHEARAIGFVGAAACGSVASASFGRVAHDDLLLAAHAPPLVGRHVAAAGPCNRQHCLLRRQRDSSSGSPLRASRQATRASASG